MKNNSASASLIANLGDGEYETSSQKQRIIIVANRLPITCEKVGDNWSVNMSDGGLVNAFLGIDQVFETKWIGYAGRNVPDEMEQRSLTEVMAGHNCIPIFLEESIYDAYYNGYCNTILWQFFHYRRGLLNQCLSSNPRTILSQYEAYKSVNRIFADVVCQNYNEGDIIWCNDYHMMFLPKYLKEKNNIMKIGWFLHAPFPSFRVYSTLPSSSELLRSVICADLVGFHINNYASNFIESCEKILGIKSMLKGLKSQGKLTRVAAIPIGIDPTKFQKAILTPNVQSEMKKIMNLYQGKKVFLGVDRLDMIKGIPQKLMVFEKFLEEHPEWHGKVYLVQIGVPTMSNVPEYRILLRKIHKLYGRINARYKKLSGEVIKFIETDIEFDSLCAMYATADIALVTLTPLRDGMNLVGHEFVACQSLIK